MVVAACGESVSHGKYAEKFLETGATPALPLLKRLEAALGLILNVSLAVAERRSA